MLETEDDGATAPATQAAVAAGAVILDLQREFAVRRAARTARSHGSGRTRRRHPLRYATPPYFPSDVC